MTGAPPFDTVKVASRVPGRKPEWKTHPTVGRAKSSIAQYRVPGGMADHGPSSLDRYGPGEVWEATPNATWHQVV